MWMVVGRVRSCRGRNRWTQPAADRGDCGVGAEDGLEVRPFGRGDESTRRSDERDGAVLVSRHHGHGVLPLTPDLGTRGDGSQRVDPRGLVEHAVIRGAEASCGFGVGHGLVIVSEPDSCTPEAGAGVGE